MKARIRRNHFVLRFVAVLLLAGACAKDEPVGTQQPPDGTLTVDGKPMPLKTALIWRVPDGTFEMIVSTHVVGCEDVAGEMRRIQAGEHRITAGLSKDPRTGGTPDWTLRWASFGANQFGDLGPVTVTGEVAARQRVTVTMKVQRTSFDLPGEPKKTIKVEGTFEAIGCPSPPAAP